MLDIVPPGNPQGKHYVYTLSYPESMGGRVFYVGKGQGDRINDHEREARTPKTHNNYKCAVIRKIWKNGEQIVKTITAYCATHEEASLLEVALIFFLPGLTNLTRGGDGIVGLPRTAEHQRKIADALRGRKVTQELRQKLSDVHKQLLQDNYVEAERLRLLGEGHKGKPSWNKGIPNSEEHCKNMSVVRKGVPTRPCSDETKRKISEANTGKKRSAEAIKNSADARRGIPLSKPRTEEYKRKLSIANSKKVWQGFIAPDGTRYENIINLSAFCQEHGLTASRMGMVGRDQCPHHKGWRLLPIGSQNVAQGELHQGHLWS